MINNMTINHVIVKTVTRTKQYWTKEQHRRIIIYMGPMGGINGFI
jgi:hypothetical protein